MRVLFLEVNPDLLVRLFNAVWTIAWDGGYPDTTCPECHRKKPGPHAEGCVLRGILT
jgi:hypothetical protein